MTNKELLQFIDSLPKDPKESVSEDLEEEIDRFEEQLNTYNQSDYPDAYTVRNIARHFAEWQKQRMIEKVVKWLEENLEENRKDYSYDNYI